MTVTVFNSNEEAIAKLEASGGTSGFDLIIPTGVYIPQMAADGLIDTLDTSKLANFGNIDPIYLGQTWDPDNTYSVPKDWGSTGWIYDNTVITEPLETWSDFLAAAEGPASGQVSVLDTAPNVTGLYFWANGIDWTTTDPKDLDACEDYIVNTLASHLKAFDSYPGINLTSGNYILSNIWNGDARQGLQAVDDPDKYTWALGAPTTELWMDNYVIVKDGAEPRLGLCVHRLHARSRELGHRPRVPRLQHRAEGHRVAAACRPAVQGPRLLHARTGEDDGRWGDQRSPGPPRRHLQQSEGEGRSVIVMAKAKAGA